MDQILFFNPKSGSGFAGHIRQHVEKLKNTKVFSLAASKDLIKNELLKLTSNDRIIIVGGDGSVSSLAPHHDKCKASILIIPTGTCNDMARSLGFLHKVNQLSELLQRIEEENYSTQICPVVRVIRTAPEPQLEMTCLNYVSFGFDAYVMKRYDELRRRKHSSDLSKWIGPVFNKALVGVAAFEMYRRKFKDSFSVYSSSTSYEITYPFHALYACTHPFLMGGKIGSEMDRDPSKSSVFIFNSVGNYAHVLSSGRGAGLFAPPTLGSKASWKIDFKDHIFPVQIDGEFCPTLAGSAFTIEIVGSLSFLIPSLNGR